MAPLDALAHSYRQALGDESGAGGERQTEDHRGGDRQAVEGAFETFDKGESERHNQVPSGFVFDPRGVGCPMWTVLR